MTQTILITGGATRLGLALATHYRAHGWTVLITYNTAYSSLDDLRALGVTCYPVNFLDMPAVSATAQQILREHPCLDVLVHNASAWEADQPGADNHAVLMRMMQIHVSAPMVLTEALVPALTAAKDSSVILISDHVARRGSDQHMAYAASKAAMLNLTLSLAKKYAPNIRVNALTPALLEFRADDDAAYREKARAKSPLQRVPGFIAGIRAVDYLISQDYLTGAVLPLDGGRPLGMP
ncbi:MAG: dihydromonapterin reductase [Litorivicinaceae bacterium]